MANNGKNTSKGNNGKASRSNPSKREAGTPPPGGQVEEKQVESLTGTAKEVTPNLDGQVEENQELKRCNCWCFVSSFCPCLRRKNNQDELEKCKRSLKSLRRQMRRVKWYFHCTRNNPVHTEHFYFALKAIAGLDNWNCVRPDVRQAWEDASRRFDMQYGIVKALAANPEALLPIEPAGQAPENQPRWLSELCEKIDGQTNSVDELRKQLNLSYEDYRKKLDEMDQVAQDALDVAEKSMKTLKAFRGVFIANQDAKEDSGK